jgi:hypothetical protein
MVSDHECLGFGSDGLQTTLSKARFTHRAASNFCQSVDPDRRQHQITEDMQSNLGWYRGMRGTRGICK